MMMIMMMITIMQADIEEKYNETFLRTPQSPTVEALKADFDCPITNLSDKKNNVIEMIQKKKKKNKTLISMIFTYQNSFQSSFQR